MAPARGNRAGCPTTSNVPGPLVTLLLIIVASWLAPMAARAHPVAQGAMRVGIEAGKITVEARVSTEEVFVASTFAPSNDPNPASLNAVWNAHGPYLLNHLRVFADDRLLTGRLLAVQPPAEGSVPGSSEHVVYRFEYALPDAKTVPVHVRIEEDVLKEFSYAPGNPWTASYVVHVESPGQQPVDGLLLDRNQPLDYHPAPVAPGTAATVGNAPAPAARIDHWQVVKEYFVHGIFHILTGYDHMLFMGALVLAAISLWDLVKVVSAFTLAHTITLALSVLNIVRLPSHIVEPMISASIVFVAVQNIIAPRQARGWTRLAAAFFFGLFHGLGFAGGLLDAMAGAAVAGDWHGDLCVQPGCGVRAPVRGATGVRRAEDRGALQPQRFFGGAHAVAGGALRLGGDLAGGDVLFGRRVARW